jgi:ligand-binding sensor domain-containing protein
LDFEEFREFTGEQVDQEIIVPTPPDQGPLDMDLLNDLEVDMVIPMEDQDEDGILDPDDNCIDIPNADQLDTDEDGVGDACDDGDGDGVLDYRPDGLDGSIQNDNCLDLPNAGQLNLDGDDLGDACDPDPDGDELDMAAEMLLGTDPCKTDSDDDGFRDGQDLCPLTPNRVNHDQDQDGYGDECDLDIDGDGIYNWKDSCVYTSNPNQVNETQGIRGAECRTDWDGDGVEDAVDPCPYEYGVPSIPSTCESGFKRWGYDGNFYDVNAFTYESPTGPKTEWWFASQGGLSRVIWDEDTQSFQETQWGEESGLWSRSIKSIHVDSSGRIWTVGEQGLSLLRYDPRLVSFSIQNIDLSPSDVSGQIQAVYHWDDALYIATTAGLYTLTSTELTSIPIDGVNQANLYALHQQDDYLWFGIGSDLYRYSPENGVSQYGQVPEVGTIRKIVSHYDDYTLWLLGDQGVAKVDTQTFQIKSSFSLDQAGTLYDALSRKEGTHFASSEGLTWVDRYDRVYETDQYQGGTKPIRALDAPSDSSYFWNAGKGRATSLYGTWNQKKIENAACITDFQFSTAGSWIVGTETGADRVNPDGSRLPINGINDKVYQVVSTNTHVWAAGVGGLYSIVDQDAVGYTPTGLVGPYTALAVDQDMLWIGGSNGVAYSTLDPNTGDLQGNWTLKDWNIETLLPSGDSVAKIEINTLVGVGVDGEDETRVWIAVKSNDGTNGGIARYSLNEGLFEAPIYNTTNVLPQGATINDLSVKNERALVATSTGLVALSANPNIFRFQLIVQANGIPADLGTSNVLSIGDQGEYIWAFVAPKQDEVNPIPPYGALISYKELLNEGQQDILDSANPKVYDSDRLSFLKISNTDLQSTRISTLYRSPDSNPFTVLSVCGLNADQGSVVLLDGKRSQRRSLYTRTLKGPGTQSTLIPNSDGYAAVAEFTDSPSLQLTVTPLSSPEPYDERQDVVFPNEEDTVGVKVCRSYIRQGETLSSLVCILENLQVAQVIQNTWTAENNPAFANLMVDINDLLLDPSNPSNNFWVATNQELMYVRSGSRSSYNTMSTEGILKSNEILSLDLKAPNHLFVGTTQGLYRFTFTDPENPEIYMYSLLQYTRIEDVLYDQDTETLWVASGQGLAAVKENMDLPEYTWYTLADVLPALPKSLKLMQGILYVGHQSGVSKYQGNEWTHYGAPKSLPGGLESTWVGNPQWAGTSYQLWIQGPNGISSLSTQPTPYVIPTIERGEVISPNNSPNPPNPPSVQEVQTVLNTYCSGCDTNGGN